jgi:carbamoyl-phosphate synthase large subunit
MPRGDNPGFVQTLLEACVQRRIELVIPTVDSELVPLAQNRARYEEKGIAVALSDVEILALCLDKFALIDALRDHVPVPETVLLNTETAATIRTFPRFAKPRNGAGSRNAVLIRKAADLACLPMDGSAPFWP